MYEMYWVLFEIKAASGSYFILFFQCWKYATRFEPAGRHGGFWVQFLCSPWVSFPLVHFRLIGDSKLAVGMNVSVHGGPRMNCRLVPSISCDRLQPPAAPCRMKQVQLTGAYTVIFHKLQQWRASITAILKIVPKFALMKLWFALNNHDNYQFFFFTFFISVSQNPEWHALFFYFYCIWRS